MGWRANFVFLGDDPRHMTNMANLGKQKGRSNPLGASRQNWPGAEFEVPRAPTTINGYWWLLMVNIVYNQLFWIGKSTIIITGWWWLEPWNFEWLSIRLGMSSSQLTFTPSFFKMVFQPPTRQRCPILWVETLSGGKSNVATAGKSPLFIVNCPIQSSIFLADFQLPCLMTPEGKNISCVPRLGSICYGALECLMWTMWMRDLELTLWLWLT